jgi:hypothetical protein
MSEISETPAPPAAVTPAPRRSRGWVLPALLALVVGAGGAFAGLYLAGWRSQPERDYSVLVIFKQEATPQQKDDTRAVLEKLPHHGDVHLVTKAEAFAQAKQAYANTTVLADLTEQNMPESYRTTTTGRDFDCAPLKPLADNTGVSKLQIVTAHTGSSPGAQIIC